MNILSTGTSQLFSAMFDNCRDMSESESESASDASGSRRSSYSSESFHSDEKTESRAKKKDSPRNKGTSVELFYMVLMCFIK